MAGVVVDAQQERAVIAAALDRIAYAGRGVKMKISSSLAYGSTVL